MNFKDIPQMTQAPYRVDIPWTRIFHFIKEYKFDLNPEFQRGHVWTKEQKQEYVQFCLRGGISGKDIYFNHPGWMDSFEGQGVLVDGKQRINAVLDFLNDRVKAFGHYFSEFEGKLPYMGGCVFSVWVNNLKTDPEIYQWYLDLNAGTPHERADIQKVKDLLEASKQGNANILNEGEVIGMLTKKEEEALLAIAEHAMYAMGGKEPADLFDDNHSWFNREDLSTQMFGSKNAKKHMVSGLMSSLDDKGMIGGPDEGDWFLTEDGVLAAQKIWEAKVKDDLKEDGGIKMI